MPDWQEVLTAVKNAESPQDQIRREWLSKLHCYTGRNVIAYYSGWLSKPQAGSEINDEDKSAFMTCVHRLDRTKGLDLILHTPGGSIAATQSIVDYLRKIFGNDIRAIVPQLAMSAGTIMACSCKEIVMGRHSNLGPIDPHVNGWPASGVIREFKQACNEVRGDPSKIPMWQAIIGKYNPAFLGQCRDAIKWSNEFVTQQLRDVMFHGERGAARKAARIVRWLSSTNRHPSHAKHIHAEECLQNGLIVSVLEKDQTLQDLVLSVHYCFVFVLQNTSAFKGIENHLGVGVFKHVHPQPGS